MSSDNPYSAPSVDPTMPPPETGDSILATRGDRFLGAFIDGLVNFGLMLLLFAGLFAAGRVSSFGEFGATDTIYSVITSVGVFAAYVAINWSFMANSGQTIGKKVAKTKAVKMDDQYATVTNLAFKRYAFMHFIGLIPVAGGILSLINVCFIFRKDRRCLHDLIAGTKVIKIQSP